MSEHQGHVIDGTARAHHWRRSSPSPTADADGTRSHTEAPKSIASSLLVPAQMLLEATPAAPPGTEGNAVGEGPGDSPGDRLSGLVPHASVTLAERQNIFLAAERAADAAVCPTEVSLRGRVQAVIQRWTRDIRGRNGERSLRIRTTAWITVSVLGVLAALLVATTVLGNSASPQRQSHGAGIASSLEPVNSSGLAASADPFATKTVGNRAGPHLRYPHRVNAGRPRRHSAGRSTSTPVRTTRNQRVVMAHYTPTTTTPSSTGATSDTQSASSSASTPTASAPAAPRHYTSSSSSGSGSGSSSKSPSKATLRSLVTGAGQCSCQ